MMAVSLRLFLQRFIKKIYILPVLREYIISLMMFTVINLDNFQTNSVVHGVNIRANHQLQRPTVNLSCI